jgi:hypothetical protein
VTTGDILVDAYQRGLITEAEGNAIWARMIAKRRKLGAASFSDYLPVNRIRQQLHCELFPHQKNT